MNCQRCGVKIAEEEAHEGPDGQTLCPACSTEVGGRPKIRFGESIEASGVSLEEWGGPIDVETSAEEATEAEAEAGIGWRTLLVAGVVGSVAAAVTFSTLMIFFPEPADEPPAPRPRPGPPENSGPAPPVPPAPPNGGRPAPPRETPAAAARRQFSETVKAAAAELAEDFSNVKRVVENLRLLETQATTPELARIASNEVFEIEKRHDEVVAAVYQNVAKQVAASVEARKYAAALEVFAAFEKDYGSTNYFYMQGSSKIRRERERIKELTDNAVAAAERAALAALAEDNLEDASAAFGPLREFGLEEVDALVATRREQIRRLDGMPPIVKAEITYWKAEDSLAAPLAGGDYDGALALLETAAKEAPDLSERFERDRAFVELARAAAERVRRNTAKLKGREFTVGDVSGKVLIIDRDGFRISHGGTLHRFKLAELGPAALGRLYEIDPDPALGDAAVAAASMQLAMGDAAAARDSAERAPMSDDVRTLLARIRRREVLGGGGGGGRPRKAADLLPAILAATRGLKLGEAGRLFGEFCKGHVHGDRRLGASKPLRKLAAALAAAAELDAAAKGRVRAGRLTGFYRLEENSEDHVLANSLDPGTPGRIFLGQAGPHKTAAASVTDGLDGRAIRLDTSAKHIEIPLARLTSAAGGVIEFAFRPLGELQEGASLITSGDPGSMEIVGGARGYSFMVLGWRHNSWKRPPADKWMRFRIEWDRAGDRRAVYVDGKLIGSNTGARWGGRLGSVLRLNVSQHGRNRGQGRALGDYDSIKVYRKD